MSECLRCASKFIPRYAERSEDLDTHPFAEIEDAKQDVHRPDRLACSASLMSRYLEGALRAGRERNGATRRSLSLTNDASDLIENRVPGRASSAKKRTDDAVRAQREEQVLRTDVVVPETPRFFLRHHDDVSRFPGEPLERTPVRRRSATAERPRCPADVALVGGLFSHPQAPSDLGPGCSCLAGFLDEVTHQVVSDALEKFSVFHGYLEALQLGAGPCLVLHGVDDVFELNWCFALAHGRQL